MFIENKYTRAYYTIINKALQDTSREGYYEIHHILPKSLGGSHEPFNLVKLNAKEHYIAHLLLTKMCIDSTHTNKMIYALWCMINGNGYGTSRYIPSARAYMLVKEKLSSTRSENMLGDKNHFFGKKHSDISKQKISENNGSRREEVKEKMRGPRLGFKPHNYYNGWDDATKKKISDSLKGHKHSEETKQKMSEYRKSTVWVKKDGQKSRMVHKAVLEEFLSDGWSRGRGTIKTQEQLEK